MYLRLPPDGLLLLRGVACDENIAGDGNAHRFEPVAYRLELAPVKRDAFTDLLRRRELVDQEIVAAPPAGRERSCAAGSQPQWWEPPLVRRRLHRHPNQDTRAAP